MTADPSITREEARTIGARRYLGGPCQRGHEGWRYTKGSACIECVRIARGGWLKTRKRSAANMVLTLEAKDDWPVLIKSDISIFTDFVSNKNLIYY